MTQETIIWVVRALAILLVLVILLVLRGIVRRNLFLFTGNKGKQTETPLNEQNLPTNAKMSIYFTIRPRISAVFQGSEIGRIVRRQGFRPSETGQYCLFKNFEENKIFCYLLKDGAKPQAIHDRDLQGKSRVSGLVFAMRLPNCGNFLRCDEDYHTFFSLVKNINAACNGRIYVHLNGRQILMSENEKRIYEKRVAEFQEYCYEQRQYKDSQPPISQNSH